MRITLDDLPALAVFNALARERSFTHAARVLGVSKSMVSRSLARLEERLGTRLVHRTTRQLSITEAGVALVERARRMLDEAEAGLATVEQLAAAPRGTLRVNGPVTFGQLYLAPLIPALLGRYPALRVELTLEDRFVDPVADGYDLVVRVARVTPSRLAMRRLARDRRVVVGAPEYFARAGTPKRPADLLGHNCIRHAALRRDDEWRFHSRGRPISLPVTGNLEVNDGFSQRDAAVRGVGIAVLPHFLAAPEIRAGRLVSVLDGFELSSDAEIHALYPRSRPVPAKVRAFLDQLVAQLRSADLG